ncbi:flagellar hook-associated protein FlgL [Endozoicomonas sp. Mp262]|uniref:flagellar hook-associated protein FlgL n=1 Tax=Endozoicomonas sp. Mp262 TaxID=2919499 RepID=UPI0021D8E279
MRISTTQLNNILFQSMQRNSSALNETYNQVSTGKRILQPADDPIDTVRLLQLGDEKAALEQYQGNIETLERDLAREESVLGSMNNVLQRMREISLQAGNGSYGQGELNALAVELDELVEQLQGYGNYQLADGQYLFSGTRTNTKPVQQASGSFSYAGNNQQRNVSISSFSKVPANDTARSLLFNVSLTASYSSGAPQLNSYDINNLEVFGQYTEIRITHNGSDFTVEYDLLDGSTDVENIAAGTSLALKGVAVELTAAPVSGDVITIKPNDILSGIKQFSDNLKSGGAFDGDEALIMVDNTLARVGETQTSVGKRLNILSSVKASHEDIKLLGEELRTALEDVDLAEAISRMKLQEAILQASQQAYASIDQLGLFNYIR